MVSTILIVALVVMVLVAVLVVVRGGGAPRSLGRVTITKGPREGETFALGSGRTRIGALNDNDIVIPSKQVSRYHAELRARDGKAHIWDLQARNHTYVNGEMVKNRELESGDVITIGDAELRYER